MIRENLMIISYPITSIRVLGWVRTVFDLDKINQTRREIWTGTALAALCLMVVSITIFMVFFRRVAIAIQRLSNFARQLGELRGKEVNVQQNSHEINQLCSSLNYASRDLFAKEQELMSYRDNLESLVATRTAELEKEISEHRKTERTLRESEERYRLLADNATDIIWTVGMNMQVSYVSPAVTQLLGYEPSEILAHNLERVYAPSSYQRVRDLFQSEMNGTGDGSDELRQFKVMEIELLDKSGNTIHVEGNFSSLVDRKDIQRGFLIIMRDISERKKAEEERKMLQVQLQQAQKLEAIGTLAGGIAHDFNNILGAMIGYAELVREDTPEGSLTASDLDQVLKAGNRAKDLVKQILTFSRQSKDDKIPLQPAGLIKETVKLLRSSIPTTIAIENHVATSDLILADPTQIHQILMNLCTNAFHAMEESGGVLSISLGSKTLDIADLAHETQVQPGNYVELSIKDTGTGIDPEIRKKMFDPYFATKEFGKGTGMGLAITHGIVKGYGGFISCESQVGKGSIFKIYLPVWERNSIVADTEKGTLAGVGTERILFIDDEHMLAEMAQTMLEKLGYRVTVCTDSREALQTFKRDPDAFDLVITDQTMPQLTGYDLARQMLQLRPGLPVILCTGFSSVISEETVKASSIKGFTFKPVTKQAIVTLIRQVLDDPA